MADEIRSAVDFYTRHPISLEIILEKLKASRGHLERVLPPSSRPGGSGHAAMDVRGVRGYRFQM